MNRRNRTLIVVAAAIVLASLASFGVYRAVEAIPVREVPIAKAFEVVAAKPIPIGSMLAPEDMKVVPWPADSPVPGGFSKPEEIVGRGVIEPINENQPLTEAELAPKQSGAGLPPMITIGMRAMSVRVNDIVGVAGFVVPGTRVDVIVTAHSGSDTMSRVVLSDVQVLTAGTRLEQQKKDNQPIQTSVVTLLLTPQDAERLALATTDGTIMLALRNPIDVDPTHTSGQRLAGLMTSPDPPPVHEFVQGRPKVVIPEPPPAPKPYTVEAIRGAKRSEEIIK